MSMDNPIVRRSLAAAGLRVLVMASAVATACTSKPGPTSPAGSDEVGHRVKQRAVDPQPKPPSSEAQPGGNPCLDDRGLWDEAWAAWAKIDKGLRELDPNEPPDRVLEILETSLAHRCFEPARESPLLDEMRRATAAQLKDWWQRGGDRWLDELIQSDREGWVHLPPDLRRVLHDETTPHHRLARLLCPSFEAPCGAATRHWIARAEQTFNQISWGIRTPSPRRGNPCLPQPSERGDYREYRSCVERYKWRTPSLPLGEFQQPATGWFLLRGYPRGTKIRCYDLRAISLDDGSSYVARECSDFRRVGQFARAEGSEFGYRAQTELGTLPLDATREAAFMTMIAPDFEWIQADLAGFELPSSVAWIPISEPVDRLDFEPPQVRIGGAPQLSWAWIVGDETVAAGPLSSHHGAAHDYAFKLWEVAEAGLLRSTCPAQALPANLPLEVLDEADDEHLQLLSDGNKELHERLERMLEDLASQPLDPSACPADPQR